MDDGRWSPAAAVWLVLSLFIGVGFVALFVAEHV